MSLISKDRFTRGGYAPLPTGPFSLRLPVLFFLSFAMIALSRLDHPAVKELRAEAESWLAPALSLAMLPFDPARRLVRQVQSSYDGFAELERLKGENQRLRQWESRARELERKIAELAVLTKALEQQQVDFRTVRVIATSSGGFQHSALLEAGTEQGVRVGQPVINADGVLGRIVEAGRRTSRLLLLTDINSRVPVLVGANQYRAILAGDNRPEPQLSMTPQGIAFDHGEEIVTAGIGGMFPRGMRIGSTSVTPAGARAVLNARLGELEYVSVLLFDNPGIALTRELRLPPEPSQQARGRTTPDRGAKP
jgi:rod shape-determining protein MreC